MEGKRINTGDIKKMKCHTHGSLHPTVSYSANGGLCNVHSTGDYYSKKNIKNEMKNLLWCSRAQHYCYRSSTSCYLTCETYHIAWTSFDRVLFAKDPPERRTLLMQCFAQFLFHVNRIRNTTWYVFLCLCVVKPFKVYYNNNNNSRLCLTWDRWRRLHAEQQFQCFYTRFSLLLDTLRSPAIDWNDFNFWAALNSRNEIFDESLKFQLMAAWRAHNCIFLFT